MMAKSKKSSTKAKNSKVKSKQVKKSLWQRIRPRKRSYDEVLTSWQATKETLKFIKKSWKKLFWISIVYMVLYFVFVKGTEKANLDDINQYIDEILGEDSNGVIRSITLAGVVLGGSQSQASETNSLYGMLITLIFIMAVIWGVRRLNNNEPFKIRDAFYFGSQSMVTFILVSGIIAIQLVPFALGSFLYETAKQQSIIAYFWEEAIFIGVWALGSLLSAYWLAVSLNALFVVTLPNMYPLQALREAKGLVQYRRWVVFRRMIAFPIAMIIIGLILLILVAYLMPSLTVFVFEILKAFGVVFLIVYLYKIYRSMI